MAERRPRIEPYRRSDNRWDWRLIAANGRVVFSAMQGFRDRRDAERAAERARELMVEAYVERG